MAKKQLLKNKIKTEIMNIVSVPPERKGDTGYLKLTDEEIDKIVELFREILQRFTEEIIKKVLKESAYSDGIIDEDWEGLYLQIEEIQAKWLKENL